MYLLFGWFVSYLVIWKLTIYWEAREDKGALSCEKMGKQCDTHSFKKSLQRPVPFAMTKIQKIGIITTKQVHYTK